MQLSNTSYVITAPNFKYFLNHAFETNLSQSHNYYHFLLAQFSLYVHKGGLRPDSFHFYYYHYCTFVIGNTVPLTVALYVLFGEVVIC